MAFSHLNNLRIPIENSVPCQCSWPQLSLIRSLDSCFFFSVIWRALNEKKLIESILAEAQRSCYTTQGQHCPACNWYLLLQSVVFMLKYKEIGREEPWGEGSASIAELQIPEVSVSSSNSRWAIDKDFTISLRQRPHKLFRVGNLVSSRYSGLRDTRTETDGSCNTKHLEGTRTYKSKDWTARSKWQHASLG